MLVAEMTALQMALMTVDCYVIWPSDTRQLQPVSCPATHCLSQLSSHLGHVRLTVCCDTLWLLTFCLSVSLRFIVTAVTATLFTQVTHSYQQLVEWQVCWWVVMWSLGSCHCFALWAEPDYGLGAGQHAVLPEGKGKVIALLWSWWCCIWLLAIFHCSV